MKKTYHKPKREPTQDHSDYVYAIKESLKKQGIPKQDIEKCVDMIMNSCDGKLHCEEGQYYIKLLPDLKGCGNAGIDKLKNKLKSTINLKP